MGALARAATARRSHTLRTVSERTALFRRTNMLRFLRFKTLLVKAAGIVLSVSSGLIIGKEGPVSRTSAYRGLLRSTCAYTGCAETYDALASIAACAHRRMHRRRSVHVSLHPFFYA